MKISSIIGILLGLSLVLITIVTFGENQEAVRILGDISKILAGALGGALAGEKI